MQFVSLIVKVSLELTYDFCVIRFCEIIVLLSVRSFVLSTQFGCL